MPTYTTKTGHERLVRYINSWETNAPDETEFGDVTLAEIKAARDASDAKRTEIELAEAKVKRLKNEHNDMIQGDMKKLDYVTDGVVGDRRFGPNSSVYEGFGYIRESERKKGGRRKPATENK